MQRGNNEKELVLSMFSISLLKQNEWSDYNFFWNRDYDKIYYICHFEACIYNNLISTIWSLHSTTKLVNRACNIKVHGKIKIYSKYDTIKEGGMGEEDDHLAVFLKIAIVSFFIFQNWYLLVTVSLK